MREPSLCVVPATDRGRTAVPTRGRRPAGRPRPKNWGDQDAPDTVARETMRHGTGAFSVT